SIRNMTTRIGSISLALGLTVMAAASAQTVLNFDDLVIPGGSAAVAFPPGYGGLNWPSNMEVVGPFSGGIPSLPNEVAFGHLTTGFGESDVTFINGPKVFDGAYFKGDFLGGLTAQFNLYNSGN